jgi:hypothetical protein
MFRRVLLVLSSIFTPSCSAIATPDFRTMPPSASS